MSRFLYHYLILLSLLGTACNPVHQVMNESEQQGSLPESEVQNKTVYTVLSNHCLSCHQSGSNGATDWGVINSMSDLDLFAKSSRIKKGDPEGSSLLLRTKHGIGDQSMPPSGNSFLVEDYLIIYNWIKNLPPDNVTPVPPAIPPPAQENAFTVLQTYCLNCHNGAGGPSWGTIQNISQLITFAYSGSARLKPGKANESTIILRMKHGPGDQSMPPGATSLTAQQYQLVYNWIQDLPPAPIEPPPGPNLPPPPADMYNRIALSNGEKLRLGDRRFVASVLNNVLGASAKTIIDQHVLSRTSKFGGACDRLNSYTHSYPTVIRCNEPGPSLTSKLVNVDLADIDAPRLPDSNTSREGLRVLTCKQALLGDNMALSHIIQQVKGSSDTSFLQTTPRMSSDDVKKMYRLFYPGRDPKPPILSALLAVSDEAQIKGLASVGPNGVAFESWRYVALTLCKAPDWQLE
jgi:mono/diheme cytochrome c family protein